MRRKDRPHLTFEEFNAFRSVPGQAQSRVYNREGKGKERSSCKSDHRNLSPAVLEFGPIHRGSPKPKHSRGTRRSGQPQQRGQRTLSASLHRVHTMQQHPFRRLQAAKARVIPALEEPPTKYGSILLDVIVIISILKPSRIATESPARRERRLRSPGPT